MAANEPSVVEVPATILAAAADELANKQWLLTDGLGGYACGNGLDMPRRRYDCWLTALSPDGRRVRLVAGADERLFERQKEHILSAVHWRSLSQPSVPAIGRTFRVEPLPQWTLRTSECELEKTLAMVRGRAAVVVRYRNTGGRPYRLRVRPLLCGEDADHLLREREADLGVREEGSAHEFQLANAAGPLWLCVDGPARVIADACWYREFYFAVDAARGYDAVADRASPIVVEADLAPGDSIVLGFAVGAPLRAPSQELAACQQRAAARRAWAQRATSGLAQRLRRGVDDFFYRAPGGRLGVLAGFPWFGEWGRDVFVALPGMTLAVDEPERCGEVLRAARPFLRRGLLPNIYGTTPDDSHYGSADAALWYSLCVQRWQEHAGADAVRSEFGPVLAQIAQSYLDGTDLGLRVDDEGLLFAGSPEHNATWMDARTSRGPVTPRAGQPVEIVALWCALLSHLGELYGDKWQQRAASIGAAFVRRFWRADARCLFDRRENGRGDVAVRPNMIVAAALQRSPLDAAMRQAIVDVVQRELVTPRGLRTLAPRDPSYRGRYEGGPEERDGAYHQGTAWPWLSGFFVEAALRAATPQQLPAVRATMLGWLQGFVPEIDRGGGDHLAEVFDGDAPQRPGGTFAQAWNTGELLRAVRLCTNDSGEGAA